MTRLPHLFVPILLSGALGILASPHADAQAPVGNLEIMLAIDTSGSMRPAIEAAKSAANEFVMSMPAEAAIGVETFGDEVNVLTRPTGDRALLVSLINAIVTDGDTALYDGVFIASQQFTPAAEQKVIVLLSDGKDEGSMAPLEVAIAAVQGVHVEAISLTTADTDITSLSALGTVTSADDAAGMSAAFVRVADLVTHAVAAPPPTPAPTTAAPPTTAATTTAAPTTAAPTTTAAPAATAAPTTTPRPVLTSVVAAAAAIDDSGPPAAGASASMWLGATGIFGGLFLCGLLVFPRRRVSQARLGTNKPRSVSEMGKRTVSAVDQALERHGKRTDLATALVVADISTPPGEFLATVAAVAVVGGLAGFLLAGPLIALLVATTVCLCVWFYVRRTRAKRQALFFDQLPDVLQLVTSALRTGFGLTQALDAVAEEAEEPSRSQFAHVLVEARLGRDLSEAMRALAKRMNCEDLQWVVAAIDINRDTGGNLSEILNTVSATIRERQRMARQADTLTAEGRMSARILTAMPLGMALWQWRTNPDTFALLLHGGGRVALIIGAILMLLGTVWVRRIATSLSR